MHVGLERPSKVAERLCPPSHSARVSQRHQPMRCFLLPPLRGPKSPRAHSRQLPLSRELGPAAERQARRGPDRPPLSRSPLPGGSGTCSSRAPGPRAGWLPVQTGPGRGATSLAGDPPLCPPLRLSLSHSWMPPSSWQQKDMTDTVRARQSPSGRGRAEDKNRNIYSYEGLTQGLPDRSVIKSRLEPSAWKRALSGRQRVRKDTPTLPHVRGPKLHGLVRNVQVLGDSAKKMDRKGSATHTGHTGPGRTFTTHCKEGALLTTPVTRAEKTHVRRGAGPGTTRAPLPTVTCRLQLGVEFWDWDEQTCLEVKPARIEQLCNVKKCKPRQDLGVETCKRKMVWTRPRTPGLGLQSSWRPKDPGRAQLCAGRPEEVRAVQSPPLHPAVQQGPAWAGGTLHPRHPGATGEGSGVRSLDAGPPVSPPQGQRPVRPARCPLPCRARRWHVVHSQGDHSPVPSSNKDISS